MEKLFNDFYKDKLTTFGLTAQGVGWKNQEAQRIRFDQLLKIITPGITSYSVNDLGCGTGDLLALLRADTRLTGYTGYDVMAEMVDHARNKYTLATSVAFKQIASAEEMDMANFTIASGIFNIRFAETDAAWLAYIKETVVSMNSKSSSGFAFNCLTLYSDAEFMRNDLYYADPMMLFDFCKRNFSKNVALLHDYDQYDFTILVRK